MKLFLDTEFSSLLAAESQLISLALVAKDGREFYAELPPSTYQKTCSPFVQQTVTPLIWDGRYEMPLATLTEALRTWIDSIRGSRNRYRCPVVGLSVPACRVGRITTRVATPRGNRCCVLYAA